MRRAAPEDIDISIVSDKVRRAQKRQKAAGILPEDRKACDCYGCAELGTVRTASSPRSLQEYRYLCADHAREHHQKWDFFQGMSEQERKVFFEAGSVWDRPTQKMGSRKRASTAGIGEAHGWAHHTEQAFMNMFEGPAHGKAFQDNLKQRLPPALRQCLADLELTPPATKAQARANYKRLLKHYHPDLNDGDRGFEDKLNRIISAWRQIKQTKLIPA